MKNFKWSTTSFDSSPIHVVLFVSRNKDNAHIENFTERRVSFITHDAYDDDHLLEKFEDFVNKGKPGELSRMYYSVNERDPQKIYQHLLHFLIDEPNFNLCSIMPKLAGIAAMKECAKEKRWMFDFDSEDEIILNKFTEDIYNIDPTLPIYTYKTPHGYAVIVGHGFDTREIIEKYKDIATLKKDDLICVSWKIKGENNDKS